ncbi:hypothetical protein [Rickettsia endosymbiont of Orchestes rusci]
MSRWDYVPPRNDGVRSSHATTPYAARNDVLTILININSYFYRLFLK